MIDLKIIFVNNFRKKRECYNIVMLQNQDRFKNYSFNNFRKQNISKLLHS